MITQLQVTCSAMSSRDFENQSYQKQYFYADEYACTERIEVLIEGMVLKIPFPLLRSPILRVMYVWRCVEQERRLQFSLLVFLWFVHSVGLRHFGLGILLKISVIDLHLTLLPEVVCYFIFSCRTFIFFFINQNFWCKGEAASSVTH